MEKRYHGFEGLELYQVARAFRNKVSILSRLFPAEEKYILRKQVLRSSRSIIANNAGGYGRFYYPEFIEFCRIARGSLSETPDHLICAADEGYISVAQLEDCRSDSLHISRSLNGFIQYLNRQAQKSIKKAPILTNSTNTTNTTKTHA